MTIEIPIKLLDESVVLPEYAHPGDAGIDLRSTESIELKPFERALVPCGFSLAIPQGYAGYVIPRSGLAIKNGISIVNAPGLIDSNYRGEIKVIIINLDPHNSFTISPQDRIGQLVILETPLMEFREVNELEDSSRGAQGFGSSGIH